VPDAAYRDPVSGMGRSLLRDAMKDILPDEIRLNRHVGVQGADLVPQLRATASEVNEALDEVGAGRAVHYLDMTHLLACWRYVQANDTPEAHIKAARVLLRGVMFGLAVNER
jgi:Asparagine synthase